MNRRSSLADSALAALALAVAPAALGAQTPPPFQGTRESPDHSAATGATARLPARFAPPTLGARPVPRAPSLATDSADEDRNAGAYAAGGAFVGVIVAFPAARREAPHENDCMSPICGVPFASLGVELLGAGLGAIGGLIVRKIVQH